MGVKENNEHVFAKEEVPKYVETVDAPSIIELVKKDPLQVPEKYVRSHEEMEIDNYMPHLSSAVPIIDFALLSDGDKEELSKLDIACKEWGGFKLVNHGVKKEVLQRVKDVAAKFFSLPVEEKQKSSKASDDVLGYGHDPVLSEDQVLEWSDSFVVVVYPDRYSNPSYWPQTPKEFKEIVEEYSSELSRVDDDVSGLEIKHKGNWVPLNPMPDAIDVLLGDLTEIWSNGKYKSLEHRAVINKNKERTSHLISMAPVYEVAVEPLDNLVDEQNPKLYKKVRYDDYLQLSFKQKFRGKSHVELVKIKE
ncbi:hypothetical protein RIF29_30238 [Crotalaria pallida]|uniref:Uncharacterized protein n=1 Tax=Crotalaria pallida TaxID=3830 RepID=A0AAN9EL45_CROPI